MKVLYKYPLQTKAMECLYSPWNLQRSCSSTLKYNILNWWALARNLKPMSAVTLKCISFKIQCFDDKCLKRPVLDSTHDHSQAFLNWSLNFEINILTKIPGQKLDLVSRSLKPNSGWGRVGHQMQGFHWTGQGKLQKAKSQGIWKLHQNVRGKSWKNLLRPGKSPRGGGGMGLLPYIWLVGMCGLMDTLWPMVIFWYLYYWSTCVQFT